MSLQYAVQDILTQAGLKYDFDGSLKNANSECKRWVTPNIENKPCSAALEELLNPLALTYELDGDTVRLKRK